MGSARNILGGISESIIPGSGEFIRKKDDPKSAKQLEERAKKRAFASYQQRAQRQEQYGQTRFTTPIGSTRPPKGTV